MIEVKIEENSNENDIFFHGNIVQSESGQAIVIITELSRDTFEGIVLKHPGHQMGAIYKSWVKSMFSQFTGSITLTYKP